MIEKITDDIYTSGKTVTKAELASKGIKYVIYLSDSPLSFKADEILPIVDGSGQNRPEQFIKILKSIDKQVKAGNTPLLIMCKGGISRSPTIAALYLVYSHQFESFGDAMLFVQKKSSLINFNYGLLDFIRLKVLPLM